MKAISGAFSAYYCQVLNPWNLQPELIRIPAYSFGELWEVAERAARRGVAVYVRTDGLLVV